jgi:hypothetical protein
MVKGQRREMRASFYFYDHCRTGVAHLVNNRQASEIDLAVLLCPSIGKANIGEKLHVGVARLFVPLSNKTTENGGTLPFFKNFQPKVDKGSITRLLISPFPYDKIRTERNF